MDIPYSVEERPDTGLVNGKLGLWLFLASEVMLFGAMFSTYIILRTGAEEWPHGALNVWLGLLNTFVLIASSVTIVHAWSAVNAGQWGRHRLYLALTLLLAAIFLVVKYVEYAEHFAHGEYPSRSTFFGLYFALTGLHLLHILGGAVVMAYLLGPGAALYRQRPKQFANRVEYIGLYWHFVDVVWIFLFPLLYLS